MEFFNDLGKKFNQAARSLAGWGREERGPSEKLAEAVRAAEAELHEAYARLGQACYEALGKPGALPQERIADVRTALEKLDALEQQRQKEKALRRCPFCQSLQEGDARFCSACGRPMTEDSARAALEVAEEAEYCPECGALREEGQDRCAFCGRAFGEAGEPEAAPLPLEAPGEEADAPEEPEDREEYGE